QGLGVESEKEVAKSALGRRGAVEAQPVHQTEVLAPRPLGDGGEGTRAAEDGGAGSGQQRREREALAVGAARIGDTGEVGKQTAGGIAVHARTSTGNGLAIPSRISHDHAR